MIHAFDGDPRRSDEGVATLYADLGYGGTKIAICHGTKLVFAKSISFAGRALDARLAAAHGGCVEDARQARMAAGLAAWSAPEPPMLTATIAREAVESLADELNMCMRYHGALFPDHPVQRALFAGGEARDRGLCQALAETLELPVKVGDPLAPLLSREARSALDDPAGPHSAWAVAFGLAAAPTDL
jgi:Tfp pilus assembly PilM family ATPase